MKQGDIIDIYGRVLTREKKLELLEVVHSLPASGKINEILNASKKHPVLVVGGETGSGKSTQIPKGVSFANPNKRIVTTGPRVISTIACANRVSLEMLAETGNPNYSIGRKVGYRTGPEKSHPFTSPLSFHTDGLELRRQMVAGIVPDILILDEAHGFSVASEMISWNMRERLRKDPGLRLIITSATLNPEVFRQYFKNIDSDIPVIEIPGRTFPVHRVVDSEGSYIEDIASEYRKGKNILFFVPGKKEIENEIERLRTLLGVDAQIFPLHAELPKEEQEKLLKKDQNDPRPRIIVATNVAEESITIDYIDFVIDLATHKVARFNQDGIPGLYPEDIPQSRVKQRSGRAGRTHPGDYRRYNDVEYVELPEYGEAPIEKEMLDAHILMLLAEGVDMRELIENAENMGETPFYHEFDRGLLHISYERLKNIGALTKDNCLTELGYSLLQHPIDIYFSRMLHESIDRGCVEEIMIIVSILEKKGFLSKEDTWKELGIAKSDKSDLLGYVELFRFFTATQITTKQAQKLINLGVDKEEIDDFMSRSSSKNKPMLYEVVDLTIIGLKKARIKAVYDKYLELRKRFEMMNIEISEGKNSDAIFTCIATGSLFHTYTYHQEEGGFKPQKYAGRDADMFRMGNISVIEPKDGGIYLGQPFIIGAKDESSKGLHLLSFITEANDAILKEARNKNSQCARRKYIKPDEAHAQVSSRGSHAGEKKVQVKKDIHGPSEGIAKKVFEAGIESKILGGTIRQVEPVQEPTSEAVKGNTDKYNDVLMGVGESYASSLEQLNDAPFTSEDAAKEYYLRYCLPLFLIEHNQGIKKFVRGKSEEWIAIFRELLSRFIEEEAHRINMGNIEHTERSFRYDSGILQRFEESDDRFIRYFRVHGKLPETPQSTSEDDGSGYSEGGESGSEFIKMGNEYARLLGDAKHYRAMVSLEFLEKEMLRSIIFDISEGNGRAEEVWAYSMIHANYESISQLNQKEVNDMGQSLKSLHRIKKELEKLKKRKVLVDEFLEGAVLAADERYKAESLMYVLEKMPDKFGIFDGYRYKESHYNNTLRLAFSNDRRQRKRGAITMKMYRDTAIELSQRFSTQIQHIESNIPAFKYPQIRILGDALYALTSQLFTEEYSKLKIQPKILDTLRALVRDQKTEKVGVDEILYNLLDQTHAADFIVKYRDDYKQIREFLDLLEIIENHRTYIFQQVKKSQDSEFIGSMLSQLEGTVRRLKGEYAKLMRNPLYIRFVNQSHKTAN